MTENEIIDLTSSPEVSPAPVRKISRKTVRNPRENDSTVPEESLPATQLISHSIPTSSPLPSSPEYLDTSFLQQPTQQPRVSQPEPSEPSELDPGAFLDPTDTDWRPSQQYAPKVKRKPTTAQPAKQTTQPAKPTTQRTKRTREERAAEAAAKKAAKAAETALRKEQRDYDSDKNVLKYVTAHLDPSLITTKMGAEIAKQLQQTQEAVEHERITFKVTPSGLLGFSSITWTRKVPILLPTDTTNEDTEVQIPLAQEPTGSGMLQFEERDEPHIIVCFEAEEFVNAVQRDRLRDMWRQLKDNCSGKRVHLLVNRLDGYLTTRERSEFRKNIREGDGSNCFQRGNIDAFVASLAVERPGVTFRDVRVADEGALHVCLVTKTIAKSILKKNDADQFLRAKANKESNNLQSLLASHPIDCYPTKTLVGSLCNLPSVGPQIAHPICTHFRSLGALGSYLLSTNSTSAEKLRELESMSRVGCARTMRVGPKAARQLVEVLMHDNPDLLVHEDK